MPKYFFQYVTSRKTKDKINKDKKNCFGFYRKVYGSLSGKGEICDLSRSDKLNELKMQQSK